MRYLSLLELKMNWFRKFCAFLQSFYIAEVSHPTINVLQIENFEDGVLTHLGIKGIDDTALFDYCVSNILTLLKDGFRAESDPWCLNLIFFEFASAQFKCRIGLQFLVNVLFAVCAKP